MFGVSGVEAEMRIHPDDHPSSTPNPSTQSLASYARARWGGEHDP